MPTRVLRHKAVRRSILGAGTIAMLAILGVAVTVAWLDWRYRAPASTETPAALRREIATLKAEHAALRARLTDAQQRDVMLEQQPSGDVVVALPTAFVGGVVQDIVTGWFSEVELHLRNLHMEKSGTVRAKMRLLGKRTVGDYTMQLDLSDVRGRLEPEAPTLQFGGDAIAVALPVNLTGGEGRGTMRLDWNSRGLAGPICGDLAAAHAVHGQVIPQRYVARGRLRLTNTGRGITVTPEFPGLSLRVRVSPARASVQAMEALLESKGPLCDIATAKGRVEERILALVGRGFLVRVPQKFFRSVRIPISVEEQLPLLDKQVAVTVVPHTARITSRALWLSANVIVQPVAER